MRDRGGDVEAELAVLLDDRPPGVAEPGDAGVIAVLIADAEPGRAARPARDRLREVALVPSGRLREELFTALVDDPRLAAPELREADGGAGIARP